MARLMYLPFLATLLAVGVRGIPIHPAPHTDGPKHVWPTEFSAPFGLFATFPYINNASSMIYYSYTNKTKGMVLDFKERCPPFATYGSFLFGSPCTFWFTDNGIFMAQPVRGVRCCSFQADSEAPDPNFLEDFSLVAEHDTIEDLYGAKRDAQLWSTSGPMGVSYWTVPDSDTTPAAGQPLVFGDVGGVYWRWGNMTVGPPPPKVFELPAASDECEQACPWFYGKTPPIPGGAARAAMEESVAHGPSGIISETLEAIISGALSGKEAVAKDTCKGEEDQASCGTSTGCQWCVTIDLEWCQVAGKKCKE